MCTYANRNSKKEEKSVKGGIFAHSNRSSHGERGLSHFSLRSRFATNTPEKISGSSKSNYELRELVAKNEKRLTIVNQNRLTNVL